MKQHPVVDAPAPATPDRRRTRVIDLNAYRVHQRVTRSDPAVHAIWDQMDSLAQEAWIWRDPDSIVALERVIAVLKDHVLTDWRE